MNFLRKLFSRTPPDGPALARSPELADYAQIDLLSQFQPPRPLHTQAERRPWERVLPRSYEQTISLFLKQGWLEPKVGSGDRVDQKGDEILARDPRLGVTEKAQPFLAIYRERLEREKAQAMDQARRALEERDTSQALAIRRAYEARFPLGKAPWTGPEPQLSHSALTRRILFLDHWLVADLSPETQAWLKLYAAEQHLWGAGWRLPAEEIPTTVAEELVTPGMDGPEAAYWRAQQLVLYVENQETWQRCKGGDHVRRLAIQGPDDEFTCDHCRRFRGQEFLVDRVPELPHRECTSPRGCRCQYVPVLES